MQLGFQPVSVDRKILQQKRLFVWGEKIKNNAKTQNTQSRQKNIQNMKQT